MDLLQNPFHILGATIRDDRSKITELAEGRSLLSDSDSAECRDARVVLTHPLKRLSAEVAWLPGADPERVKEILKRLEAPDQYPLGSTGLTHIAHANFLISQYLLGSTGLTHIAHANFLVSGLLRLLASGLLSLEDVSPSNVVEWIIAIAKSSEAINSELVCTTLNEERSTSGFPKITDMSAVEARIRDQKQYYRQVITSILEALSASERARILTLAIERSADNSKTRCPILIEDVINSYELGVADLLEKKQKIIEAQSEKLRVMVDGKNQDTTLTQLVNQLIQEVKAWDTIAQPIQLSKKNRGERNNASFDVAWRVRELAIYLTNEYNKLNFSQQLINMLLEVFKEVPEIAERLTSDSEALEQQAILVRGLEKFEDIQTQVDKLKKAADAKKPDSTLEPMINHLIQTVKTWDVSTQPADANSTVAIVVRNVGLHLWNEHQKLHYAIRITNMLLEVFRGVPEIVEGLTSDSEALEKQAILARGLEKFENIQTQVDKLKRAADAKKPDSTLEPIINHLIQTVKTWDASTQPADVNSTVAIVVRNVGLHLWNEHQKLHYAIRITNMLLEVFIGVGEVTERLAEDKKTLSEIAVKQARLEEEEKRQGCGCIPFIILGIIITIIGLFENC